MLELIEANWLALALALVIGFVVAWWLFARGTRGGERSYRPDVLDEGAAPASRNQTLIDAPSAAATAAGLAGTGPDILAGLGEIAAAGAQEEVAASGLAGPTTDPDDLQRIKGVGPKLAGLLNSLGVTSFAQIAAWSDADIDRIDAQLGTFAGRIRRDNWIEQARLLHSDDIAAYEARFGKL